MRKNIKKITNLSILLFFLILLVIIFNNRLLVTKASITAVNIWFTRVFPMLFIMFIVQDFLINYNFAYYVRMLFGNFLSKLFNLSTNGIFAFILSFISGCPASSYVIKNLYIEKKISNEEANKLLHITYFTNPLFTYNILMIIFSNISISLKIIVSFYISNIIIAYFLPKIKISNKDVTFSKKNNFGNLLISSIKNSISTLTLILGTITFFMIISFIASSYLENNLHITLIQGLLEITSGLEGLINLNILSKLKEIIAISIISFGGLSIHTQVFSMISDTDLKYFSFLKGRVYSLILSVILISIF